MQFRDGPWYELSCCIRSTSAQIILSYSDWKTKFEKSGGLKYNIKIVKITNYLLYCYKSYSTKTISTTPKQILANGVLTFEPIIYHITLIKTLVKYKFDNILTDSPPPVLEQPLYKVHQQLKMFEYLPQSHLQVVVMIESQQVDLIRQSLSWARTTVAQLTRIYYAI